VETEIVAAIAIAESILLVVLVLLVRFGIWPMYTAMRDRYARCQSQLAAVSADRDGWRDVGERALLVAQFGRRTLDRATQLVEKTLP